MNKEKLFKGLLIAILPLALIALLFVPWILMRGISQSTGDEVKQFFSIRQLLYINGHYSWVILLYLEVGILSASAVLCVLSTFFLNKWLFYSEIIALGIGVILFFVLQFTAYNVDSSLLFK